MRKSLGSIVSFILLFLSLDLSASTYKWSSYASSKDAYVNEVIYLKYVCEFSDRGELFTIVLNPKYDAKKYSLTLIKNDDVFKDAKRIRTYEYLLKAKVAGALRLGVDVNMRETTLESIVYSSGSRDDDRGEDEFKEHITALQTPKINFKDSYSDLVGKFTIKTSHDAMNVQAYQPYHMDVEISGLGNLEDIKAIEYKIEGVKIFTQKPLLTLQHTKEGTQGSWSQKFAFVGEKDFIIPEMKIQYFDLKTQSLHDLEIASSNVNVTKVYTKTELLDDVKEEKAIDFSFVYYILTFIAGFLVSKINFKREKVNSKDEFFVQKIRAIKSLDELSMLLILENERKFSTILLEIDSSESISLSEAKSKVLRI